MTDKTIQTVNPLTEQVLTTYPMMSDNEAIDIVQRSHDAYLEWRLKSLDERAGVIAAIAVELRKSKDEFAHLMTDEMGKLLSDGRNEVELCASICDYTANHGPKITYRDIDTSLVKPVKRDYSQKGKPAAQAS